MKSDCVSSIYILAESNLVWPLVTCKRIKYDQVRFKDMSKFD